jgi:hypothetical protein
MLRLGIFLFVIFAVLIGAFSVLRKDDSGPPIDSRLNDTSEFITQYQYPFASDEQRRSLERDAYLIYYGGEVYDISPDSTNVWPSGYGQPVTMSVFFPAGTLNPSDPESIRWTDPRTKTIYSCFRGLPVPRNNPDALNRILGIFEKGEDFTSAEFQGWQNTEPVMLCFAEGTEPDPTVQFLDVLGVYRFNSDQTPGTPGNGQPASGFDYPMILVGSSENVGYDQIAATARSILRSGVTFQRGDLRITLDRVELAPNSTRVHFTVINGSNDTVTWNWRVPKTFLLIDGQSGQSVFPETAGTQDELQTSFGPARSSGSIFFPRIQQPSQSLVLKIADPVDASALIEINLPLDQLREVPAGKRL